MYTISNDITYIGYARIRAWIRQKSAELKAQLRESREREYTRYRIAMRQFRVDMREWQMALIEREWRRGNQAIFRPQFRGEADIALGWRFVTRENEREFLLIN
jgi:hypothetical protein